MDPSDLHKRNLVADECLGVLGLKTCIDFHEANNDELLQRIEMYPSERYKNLVVDERSVREEI